MVSGCTGKIQDIYKIASHSRYSQRAQVNDGMIQERSKDSKRRIPFYETGPRLACTETEAILLFHFWK